MAHHREFPVAGVILGAGAGSRFGEPKVAAQLSDGRTFLDAVATVARDAGLDPLIAVVPPGTVAPVGVTVLPNAKPEGEQVVSLRHGIAHLANARVVGVVVWPVDHPFVSLESVLALIDAARRTNAPVVRPAYEGAHGHPVFFHRDTWRELMTVAHGGARAVVHAYGSRVATVGVRDPGVLRDIDTKADLGR